MHYTSNRLLHWIVISLLFSLLIFSCKNRQADHKVELYFCMVDFFPEGLPPVYCGKWKNERGMLYWSEAEWRSMLLPSLESEESVAIFRLVQAGGDNSVWEIAEGVEIAKGFDRYLSALDASEDWYYPQYGASSQNTLGIAYWQDVNLIRIIVFPDLDAIGASLEDSEDSIQQDKALLNRALLLLDTVRNLRKLESG